MYRLYVLALITFGLNMANAKAVKPIDSVGVENYKGNKVILHKVERKETYYAISRRYSVPYQEIIKFNDAALLQPGIIIKVPTHIPFTNGTQPATVTATVNNSGYFEYTVQRKDNLNLLATRYGTTVDAIKEASGISSINLQIGQVLRIPKKDGQPAVEENEKVVENSRNTTAKPIATSNENLQATGTYTVKPKDNLNLIARNLNTTVSAIKEANNLTSNNLRIGQILKIPGSLTETLTNQPTAEDTKATERAQRKEEKRKEEEAEEKKKAEEKAKKLLAENKGGFEYTVGPQDNIYTIAKKFNLTTYQLKTANKLESNDIKVGQKLIIVTEKPAETAQATETTSDSDTSSDTIKDPKLRLPAARYGLTQVEEKGPAVWIDDKDLDSSKMLVLHRTAPVGTVIKITNPMTSRSTYAKVVGKFTDNDTTKDVILVMTKAVAEAVGALDKRFYCNLIYGAPATENAEQ